MGAITAFGSKKGGTNNAAGTLATGGRLPLRDVRPPLKKGAD
jgi:hypothetical protein